MNPLAVKITEIKVIKHSGGNCITGNFCCCDSQVLQMLLWTQSSAALLSSQPVFILNRHMGEAAHPSDEHMSHADTRNNRHKARESSSSVTATDRPREASSQYLHLYTICFRLHLHIVTYKEHKVCFGEPWNNKGHEGQRAGSQYAFSMRISVRVKKPNMLLSNPTTFTHW